MLIHQQVWSDFVLSLDFKISPRCNSGVFFRTFPLTPRPGKDVGFNGLEIAIDDTQAADIHDTGAIYDLVKPAKNAMKPVGEWNRIVLTCDNHLVTIELNGETVTRMNLDEWPEANKRADGSSHKFDVAYKTHPRHGYIGLQDHGTDCWYKNIKLKPLTERISQRPIFTAGEGGYHTYRIPSLIATARGTLLAFCEGRKAGRGDAGDIDLVLRRSFDGGRTWSPTQVVWDDGPNTCGNPCPVVDRESGTIWLLLTHNLGQDTESQIVSGTSTGSRTVWVSKSTDDGATWAAPIEITRDVKLPDWTWYATGPGVGIQLRSGRLVIPCDNKLTGGKAWQSHLIYSDDRGATWKLGGVVGPQCNESQVAELADGALLLNMRSFQAHNRRFVATSKDGGLTWTAPAEDQALIEPVCQASLLRYDDAVHAGAAPARNSNVLLFSNPGSTKRERLTVRLSEDGGQTWPAASTKILHPGPAAYSCLAVLPDGTIACLYERGDKNAYETITLARFTTEWLRASN